MKAKIWMCLLSLTTFFALVSCQPADVPSQGTTEVTTQQTTAETTAAETAPAETTPETTAPVLDGSFSTPDYEVTVLDGKCYLNFTDGNEFETNSDSSNGGNMSMVNIDYIRFDSLAEMKQKLMNNELTDEQKDIIKAKFTLSENGFEICNVQELIQPVVPSEISIASVFLYGEDYTFDLVENTANPKLSAGMYFGDAGKWERNLNQWMEIIEKNQLDSHETDTVDGITTETYVYTTKSAQLKRVFLTIPGEDGQAATHIMIKYILQADSSLLTVSDTVPAEIFIFGEKNGIPFDYLIHGLTEAPTVEWLSSFSIAPYVDNSDHVVS